MSAVLMKSKYVRHLSSVIRVTIISEPIGQISFKFQLLFGLDHTPRRVFEFLKNKKHFPIFHVFSSFLLTCYPMGAKTSNITPPSNHFRSFKLLLNSFSVVLTRVLASRFEILSWQFVMIFFSLSLTWDPMGAKTSKGYSSLKPLLNLIPNFSWILFSVFPTKVLLWNFWNLDFTIFYDFSSKISKSPPYPMEKPKTQFTVKRAILDNKWIKFGTYGYNMVYLWPSTSF